MCFKVFVILILQFFFVQSTFALAPQSQLSLLNKGSIVSYHETSKDIIDETKVSVLKKSKDKKDQESRFAVLKQRPLSKSFFEKAEKLSDDWTKFEKWSKKLWLKIFIINIISGLSSFAVSFMMVFFLSQGLLTIAVLAIWLGVLLVNIIAKIFFTRLTQVLYEEFSFRLTELIDKEYCAYVILKTTDKKFEAMNTKTMAFNLTMWKLSDSYILDFVFSVIGGFVAVAIYNFWLIIPYVFVIGLIIFILIFWATSKSASKDEYDVNKNILSETNYQSASLDNPKAFVQWNKTLESKQSKYINTKTGLDFVLKMLVSFLFPLLGVVLFFILGNVTFPILFFVFSLNLAAVFAFMDYLTSAHRGSYSKKLLDDFIQELAESPIIINKATWEGKRGKSKQDVKLNLVKGISLSAARLKIKSQKEEINIRNVNLHISSGRVGCLTGKSGSGKTSIAQILSGKLWINEALNKKDIFFKCEGDWLCELNNKEKIPIEPTRFSYDNLRKLVSYVSFDDSARFNVLSKDIVEKYRKKFIEYSGEFIDHYSDKDNVCNFSTGERARLKLALKLAVNESRFLVLDQPFVNLDTNTAKKILKILKTYSEKYNVGILIIEPSIETEVKELFDEVASIDRVEQSA